MTFKPYPKYKASGVEWLGDVPEGWTSTRLKYVAEFRYGDSLASEIRVEGKFNVFGSNGSVGTHCLPNTDAPAIIIGRKGSFGKVTFSQNAAFAIDTTYFVDARCTSSDLRWLYYGLQTLQLDVFSQDTGVPGLSREDAYGRVLAVPSKQDQSIIATYLDGTIAKIDTLIAKQEELIALLKEKRQAVISHAVTKGLNPNVPMKASGVEWLGDVPAHWHVAAVGYRYEVALGKMLDQKRITGNHLAPYLRNTDVQWGRINTTNLPEMDFGDADRIRYSLRAGDLLVCEGGEVGRAAIWDMNEGEYYYQKALHRMRPYALKSDLTKFMFYLLVNASGQERFTGPENKSTIFHLPAEALRACRFGFPDFSEQQNIVMHLDAITTKIDNLIAKAQQAIVLQKEHRTALISAAVTGKIDVRGGVIERKAA